MDGKIATGTHQYASNELNQADDVTFSTEHRVFLWIRNNSYRELGVVAVLGNYCCC